MASRTRTFTDNMTQRARALLAILSALAFAMALSTAIALAGPHGIAYAGDDQPAAGGGQPQQGEVAGAGNLNDANDNGQTDAGKQGGANGADKKDDANGTQAGNNGDKQAGNSEKATNEKSDEKTTDEKATDEKTDEKATDNQAGDQAGDKGAGNADGKAAGEAEPAYKVQHEPAAKPQAETAPRPTVKVDAHVQNLGWQPAKYLTSGKTVRVGTTGRALRIEALRFALSGARGGVQVQVHVQNVGWQGIANLGALAGTTGRALRLEAIRIALTGELSQWYDIGYAAHVQNVGWQSMVWNGALAGTTGRSLRLEALDIRLSPKSSKTAPGDGIIGIRTSAHVQNVGWQGYVTAGSTAGTTGRSLRVEAMRFALDAGALGGYVRANSHIQNVGWQGWRSNSTGTTGRSLRMEAVQLQLAGPIAGTYDIVYRAHVQNVGWQPWTVNGGTAGTTGRSLRVEALQIKLVKKGTSQTVAEGTYFIAGSRNPQQVVDVPGGSGSANVNMQSYTFSNSNRNQRFYLRNTGNGTVSFQIPVNGLFLTDSGSAIVQRGAASGNDVNAQRWKMSWNNGYIFTNVLTGKVMTFASTPGNGVRLNSAGDSGNAARQRFTLTDTGIVPDGAYILTNVNSGRVVDIYGANRRNGANVIQYQSNGGNNQKFTIAYLGGNTYSIRNVATYRAVQVSGSNVQMQSWNGSNAQKWRMELTGAMTFRFTNVATGKRMDIAGASKSNSANVLVAGANNNNSQKFRLSATSRVREVVNIGLGVVYQNPELPTGCESVALTEALRYYGFNIGKTYIADYFLPYSGYDFVYAFMGDPYSYSGCAIMSPGITNTANNFLRSRGSSLRPNASTAGRSDRCTSTSTRASP